MSQNGVQDDRECVDTVPDHELAASIIEAIAAERNVSLSDVDIPLNRVVDLDALETLYRHACTHDEASWEVSFSVDELDVAIGSDGSITVTSREEAEEV